MTVSTHPSSPPARSPARWVECVSWAFVALGLLLPFAFRTTAFEPVRVALGGWVYGLTAAATGAASGFAADRDTLDLMLGITGGSMAGKWTVHALLARGPLAEGKAWARDLTLRGLAAWFVVDSLASLRLGATFVVWMVNLAPLALAGLPLVFAYGAFGAQNTHDTHTHADAGGGRNAPPLPAVARACLWTSMAGAATGLVIAFGGSTPLFGPWFAGLEAAHNAGDALAEPTRRLALFFFGPVGGCVFAQFLMLAGFVRREGATMRVAAAGVISIAGWCAIDSAYGLAHNGMFNIVMINVPALIATLPPWLVLAASLRKARTARKAHTAQV